MRPMHNRGWWLNERIISPSHSTGTSTLVRRRTFCAAVYLLVCLLVCVCLFVRSLLCTLGLVDCVFCLFVSSGLHTTVFNDRNSTGSYE